MSSLLKITWLIPALPFFGAVFIAVLLVSFKRTMNRLTKPISYLLMTCVVASTVISFILFQQHLSGQFALGDFYFLSRNFHIGLIVDNSSTISLTFVGIFMVIIMFSSFRLMPREQGYAGYFTFLGFIAASMFLLILNYNPLHAVLAG